ncbi:hypothetical protein ACFYVL_29970 [Streptomyces sp. NPDC004111]|uniref:hypothetical protein n=1 Tax=Streptomyces sp. NPDC004111 TaxID=3364690 RepID=UPI003687F17E
MQRRIRRIAGAVVLTAAGSVVLSACGGDHRAAPAVTTTVTAPGPTVTVTAPPVVPAPDPATPPPVGPSSPPPSGTGTPQAQQRATGRPTVELTGDDAAATKELARLKRTGWWNPNKIEYSDDPVTTLQQFDRWLSHGYIAPDGSWTQEGVAAVEAANESGEEM